MLLSHWLTVSTLLTAGGSNKSSFHQIMRIKTLIHVPLDMVSHFKSFQLHKKPCDPSNLIKCSILEKKHIYLS